jgi:phosphatidate phosphatase PAH1
VAYLITVNTKLTDVTIAVTDSEDVCFSKAVTKLVIMRPLQDSIIMNKTALAKYST